MLGPNERKCGADHKWSGSREPICELIRCSSLDAPFHGTINCANSDFYGSECEFRCETGYELIGSDARTCGVNQVSIFKRVQNRIKTINQALQKVHCRLELVWRSSNLPADHVWRARVPTTRLDSLLKCRRIRQQLQVLLRSRLLARGQQRSRMHGQRKMDRRAAAMHRSQMRTNGIAASRQNSLY